MQDLVSFSELAPEPTLVASGDGLIKVANAHAVRLVGWEPERLVGRALRDLLRTDDTAPEDPSWVQRVRPGTIDRFYLRCARANGTLLPVDVSAWRVAYRGLDLLIAFLRDASDLARSRAMERRLMEAARIGTWKVDPDRGDATFSPEYLRLLGVDHLSLQEVAERVHPDDAERVLMGPSRSLRLGQPQHIANHRIRHADGTYRVLDTTLHLEPDTDGTGKKVLGITMDVTERAQLEEEARRSREQVMTSDRMASLGILAAGLAHEINSPLTVLLSNLDHALEAVEQARTGADRAELASALSDAHEAGLRVKQIVGDLRIYSHEVQATYPVNVNEAIRSSLRMAGNEIKHRARLATDLGAVPPVQATEARIGQVVLNLVINAAQAIPEGAAAQNVITVKSWHDPGADQVMVQVEDTGPGIPEGTLSRLFTPFFTTKAHGTGLGLSISRRVVRELGGDITVRSQLGVGTAFTVALPASSAPAHPKPSAPVETVGASGTPATARLLVIDDEPLVGTTLRRILGRTCEVTVAVGGNDAMEIIRGGARFDVILCDVLMPNGTGMDFMAQCEAVAPDQARRVVFITGGPFTPWATLFLEKSQNPRMHKPFTKTELLGVISRVMASAPPLPPASTPGS